MFMLFALPLQMNIGIVKTGYDHFLSGSTL
jgi:hypothetical protein